MTTNLTPTAQAILEALQVGPATTTALREHTGRSKTTIDKALTDLTKADLIIKVPAQDGNDTSPTLWTLPAPGPTTDDISPTPDTDPSGLDAEHPDQTETDEPHSDAEPPEEPSSDTAPELDRQSSTEEPPALEQNPPLVQQLDPQIYGPAPGSATPPASDQPTSDPAEPTAEDAPADDTSPNPAAENTTDASPDTGTGTDEVPGTPEIKLCRGCQDQMPVICPCCWQKTTAYCGTCRKDNRRNVLRDPEILSNGLPKLGKGELEGLVLNVMNTHPLPHHLGVTGWTSGRIVVFLPGRSTGAIGKSLEKLTTTGQAERLGDNPKRYQLTAPQPHPEQPPADPQPTTQPTAEPDEPTSSQDAAPPQTT